jgi:serine/threonine-protein phosphatase 5
MLLPTLSCCPNPPLSRHLPQGVGLAFGPDVTKRFCDANGITAIVRSHEVRQEGYAVEQGGLCITVFSAPNYCDQTGNKVGKMGSVCNVGEIVDVQGAVVRMKPDGELSFEQFVNVPHPDVKPMAYAGGFGFMGM